MFNDELDEPSSQTLLDQPWRDRYPELEAVDVPPRPATDANDSTEEAVKPQADTTAGPESEPDDSHITLILRDGLDHPIQGIEVQVTTPDGVTNAKSSALGAIAVPAPKNRTGTAEVKVRDRAGELQPVCKLDIARCKGPVIVGSPKVATTTTLRPHQQTPPTLKPGAAPSAQTTSNAKSSVQETKKGSSEPWWIQNGALASAWKWLGAKLDLSSSAEKSATKPLAAKTLNTAGQPVSVVMGPECPNKDNLRLGRNNVYREAILEASKRLNLIPQALCALIECEAAKKKEIIPLLDAKGPVKGKNGKPLTTVVRELWDPDSGNDESNAAGLTQFLRGTWLDHVRRPGYYIHTQSKAKDWVKQEDVPKKGKRWVFVLADKTTTTSPASHLSDANVQACLSMRMDPTWSINAAVDYGVANLKVLEAAGFKLDGLTDMDKAKLMYLMHHEGEGAGPAFIRNTLGALGGGVEGLKKKFVTQLGKSGVKLMSKLVEDAADDVELAYRNWLRVYVEREIRDCGRCVLLPLFGALSNA